MSSSALRAVPAILPSSLRSRCLLPPSLPARFPSSFFKSRPLVQTNAPAPSIRSSASAAPSLFAMAEPAISTTRGKSKVLIYDTEEDLTVALAKYTADLSAKVINERGAFTVVLSGGSLIKCMRKLIESPYTESVDWTKWFVFWVDERVVPKDHEESNYKLAYDGFLSKVSIAPGNVYSINDLLPAEGAAEDYETCLRHLVKLHIIEPSPVNGLPKFDLMLLGMGPDGHVASLFPGHPLLKEDKKWVTYIKDSPKPPPERITFTFPVINAASAIALVVIGASKADPLCTALGNDQSNVTLPVQMVSPEDGELTWFADKPAASKLQDQLSL